MLRLRKVCLVILIPSDSVEVPDKWANMFQCNSSYDVFTCAHDDISAATACTPEKALGIFKYISANVTVAQNGKARVNTTTTANVSSCETGKFSSTATESSSTCPETTSNKDQLVAMGAELGVGLGIPLLIAAGLAIFCGGSKRRKLEQKHEQLQAQQRDFASQDPRAYTGFDHTKSPEEVAGSITQYEVMGSMKHAHSELPGSNST